MSFLSISQLEKRIKNNMLKMDSEKLGIIYIPRDSEKDNYLLPILPFFLTGVSTMVNNPKKLLKIHDNIFQPEDKEQDIAHFFQEKSGIFSEDKNKEVLKNMYKNPVLQSLKSSTLFYWYRSNEEIKNVFITIFNEMEKLKNGKLPKIVVKELTPQIQELNEI